MLPAAPHCSSEPHARHQHPPWQLTAGNQSPSKADSSWGGRFKGGEESGRENSWLGKRLAGLSTSEPTLPRCPEHIPAASAAEPDKVRTWDRHQGDNLTPNPCDKPHSPSPKTCMCPGVVPGETPSAPAAARALVMGQLRWGTPTQPLSP